MLAMKRTNDEWRELLAAQRVSGQSQEAWCAAKGVNLFTFRDRASRLKKMEREAAPQAKEPEPVSAGWLDVTPGRMPEAETQTATEPAAGIRITRDAWTITVTAGIDAGLLAKVLRAVSRACC